MKAWLKRFIRRYWVKRSEYDEAIATLRLAYGHIVAHHNISLMEKFGCGLVCPVCSHEGSEPEMDEIVKTLNRADQEGGDACAS